ncbi:MAG TPA: c-type cytochrome [Sphingobium sp.]|uniref:c-type cytochrome n=1 Tax=Sphingobium sp. TaxID=1912891 RepID=UPI002ED6BE3E
MHSRISFALPLALVTFGLASTASAQDMSGEQLFKQRCGTCHATVAGKPALMAPNLRGVAGRKAGATDFKYSPALKASGLTWTPETLDQFLAAPSKLVPGTRMIVSITDAKQRKAVIDWLGTQR